MCLWTLALFPDTLECSSWISRHNPDYYMENLTAVAGRTKAQTQLRVCVYYLANRKQERRQHQSTVNNRQTVPRLLPFLISHRCFQFFTDRVQSNVRLSAMCCTTTTELIACRCQTGKHTLLQSYIVYTLRKRREPFRFQVEPFFVPGRTLLGSMYNPLCEKGTQKSSTYNQKGFFNGLSYGHS